VGSLPGTGVGLGAADGLVVGDGTADGDVDGGVVAALLHATAATKIASTETLRRMQGIVAYQAMRY
jgi:acetate kinase